MRNYFHEKHCKGDSLAGAAAF